ncbi:pro-sigmaK processing inhibitor BofA family protein [Bacillus massiliigorillae]|uniref:pro-sigmaK processing inhibitor BofA family protein n=1 Tax=Bacillus massiliigorillae TaxID=1243664 RepID=UPI00039E5AF9|nr:pro-sigmaK processing inhibitor BofA family protein [Bacillus massiliigorillae]
MDPVIIISVIVGLILLLLFLGASYKPLRIIGNIAVKIVIGAMLLFFLNAFGSSIGLHVPINVATAGVAGLLGIPGVFTLAALQYWVV